jgi:hypothetical protein
MPDPDSIEELGDSGVGFMYHGVDMSEPPENEVEQEAQMDALRDYTPDGDDSDDSDDD